MSGHHLGSLSLDETYQSRSVMFRLERSGRLDFINDLMVKTHFCAFLGEYIRETKRVHTTGTRPSFNYEVYESDLDEAVEKFKKQLDIYL